jgi:hypothetical protein
VGFINPGTGLFSQAVSRQVLSLLTVFTFVFGMGTGVFRPLQHQEPFRVVVLEKEPYPENCILSVGAFPPAFFLYSTIVDIGQALGHISNAQLHTALMRHFHLRPINRVFFPGPY